ncbi:M20 family metallopeptidase [Palleronia sediminis]|nr:M20/M25/M40 family metallo-hydrolase [Palleronia sediminis]
MKTPFPKELCSDCAKKAVELLSALVGAQSINPPGDTREPIRVARDWLDTHGLPYDIIAANPAKPNIVVRIENGAGPHLVFNAHLDTVPPGERNAWSFDPLALTERGGRLYGLGTGNMKGAAAAMMFACRWLALHKADWNGTVTLTLVADECVFGPDGAEHLLEARPDVRGDMLICGEGPGAMQLGIGEKGLLWVRLRATGRVGQGMLTTRGSAATVRIAAAISQIDAWNEIRRSPPIAALDHSDNAEGMRLSANVGWIEGGGFISQAAANAVADVDFRLPCGMILADITALLDSLCRDDGLSWELIKGWEANWSDDGTEVARAVTDAAQEVRGTAPLPVTRLPASDASRWRALGIPAVCYGPQPELASGVDDYVNSQDFLDCISIYALAAIRLLPTQTAE